MANETLGVTTEPSPEKSFIGYIWAVGLEILKFEQTSLFYSASYFNSRGLELCFGGAKPIKDPPVATGLCGKASFCFLMQLIRKST